MSHDYAKRAAQHKQQHSPHKAPAIPKGLIAITLILVPCFVAFLYYLTQIDPQKAAPSLRQPGTSVKKANHAANAKKDTAPLVETSKADNEYDFYKLLPQTEVIPPRVEEYQSKPVQPTQASTYLLQAGSFRRHEEADRLRAKLILQGLEVAIKRVKGSSGADWYRVMVGPFTSRSKLNHAQDILARANTESMLIEIKGAPE